MDILANNIYKLIIMIIIRFIFTFKIKTIKSIKNKYKLVYHSNQKLLLLENLILYVYIDSKKDSKVVNIKILEKKAKVFLFYLYNNYT